MKLSIATIALCTVSAIDAATVDRFAQLPLAFEPLADGQYVARSGKLALRVSAIGAMLGSHSMRVDGANRAARAVPEQALPGKIHYLIGADPRQWRTNVPTYARVRFHEVYPGIDLVYYGNRRELEFDFLVAPGADPGRIRVSLSGPDVEMSEPRIYQGSRAIAGRAVRRGKRVAFQVGAYDRSRTLVIDPVLSFATVFGGGSADSGNAVAVDAAGAVYVTGATSSANFPLASAYQSSVNSGQHAFVAKLNAAGTALDYSTYLGGSGVESGVGIAVDAAGNAYVGGTITSVNFPGANNPPPSGTQVFAVKLSPDGSKLVYSTYVGTRNEAGGAIAVDGSGSAYITHGVSVSKLSVAGTELYSTSLGVTPAGIAADDSGNAYVTGSTSSSSLVPLNAFQSALKGQTNAFVIKLDSRGAVAYSTYLGGARSDFGTAIAVDAAGSAYVAGSTTSANFPTARPLQPAIVTSLTYKSVDGGASWSPSSSGLGDSAYLLAVDPGNSANLYALAGGWLHTSTDGGASWFDVRGGINAIAISQSVPSILYAGAGEPSGTTDILRSADGGLTWSKVSTREGFRLLAVDPRNPDTVYGSSGGDGTGRGSGAAFYKSTDGGATWNTVFAGRGTAVLALVFAPSAPSTLYAQTLRGLLTSTDGGDHWTDARYVGRLVVDPVDSSIVYGLEQGGFLKSTDGGMNFSQLGDLRGATLLAIDPTTSATLYAGTAAGIYKTTDGGVHWQSINNGLPVTFVIALAVDPAMPSTLYVSYLYRSSDADAFVAKLSPDGSQLAYSTYLGGYGADSINALALGADGSAYLAGSTAADNFPLRDPFRTAVRTGARDGFVARLSADGSTLLWSSFLGGGSPAGIALGVAGDVYVTGSAEAAVFPTAGSIQPLTNATIYSSRNGGASWSGELGFGGQSVSFLAIDPSRVFASAGGSLFLSTDSGANWNRVFQNSNLNTLVFDPTNPSVVYAAGNALYSSTNGGATWTFLARLPGIANALAFDSKTTPSALYAATDRGVYKSTYVAGFWSLAGPDTSFVADLAIDPRNRSTLYAAGAVIRKSTNGGATWSLANGGIPGGVTTTVLAIDPAMPLIVYAAGSGGVFRSSDGGASWKAVNQGLRLSSVTAFTIDPTNSASLYAGLTTGGVYRSANRGDTWTRLPLEFSTVQALAVDPSNSARVYAGAAANPSDAFVAKIVE